MEIDNKSVSVDMINIISCREDLNSFKTLSENAKMIIPEQLPFDCLIGAIKL